MRPQLLCLCGSLQGVCAKENLHCMLDRIPAYKCFFVAVLHTDPWLCLATGLRFFCGPAGPPLTCGGEMVRWIQEVHVVKSSGASPTLTPPLQPRLQRTRLSPTCSLWLLRKHPAKQSPGVSLTPALSLDSSLCCGKEKGSVI